MTRQRTQRIATAAAVSAVAAVALPATAAAGGDIARDVTFTVEVTGTQVHDWRYRSSEPLRDEDGWTSGDGSQTIGWHTTRTAKFEGIRYLKRNLGGTRLPDSVLLAPSREAKAKATVDRTSTVSRKDRHPVCEGGDLDPECALFVPLTIPVRQVGGRRDLPMRIDLFATGDQSGLEVKPVTTAAARYAECGPDTGPGSTLFRSFGEPLAVEFDGIARRATRLGLRKTLKLRRQIRSSGCLLPQTGAGFRSCATTDVTVELRRIA